MEEKVEFAFESETKIALSVKTSGKLVYLALDEEVVPLTKADAKRLIVYLQHAVQIEETK